MSVDDSTSTVSEIIKNKVFSAWKDVKQGRAPGQEGILADVLKGAGTEAYSRFFCLYSQCMHQERLNAMVIFCCIRKNTKKKNLSNNCLISLFNVCRLFCKILINRLMKPLNEANHENNQDLGDSTLPSTT